MGRFSSMPALVGAALLLCVFLCLPLSAVRGQITYLDPIPWFAPADSTSRLAFVAEFNRFEDPTFDWAVNRLHVCAILPGGEESVFFLRMSHLSFDNNGRSAIQRWPEIRGPEENFQWETETTITSFGQPEIGATGPIAISGFDHWHYGAALGLPVGADRLYPFASVSLPLRVSTRRWFDLGPTSQLSMTGTYLMNMDSGKDLLNQDAFAGGWHLGVDYNWYRGRGSRFGLSYNLKMLGGRKSEIVGGQAWFPWSEDGSVGVKVARDLSGSENRPALWYFGLGWRFDSPGRRPGAEALAAEDSAGQVPSR